MGFVRALSDFNRIQMQAGDCNHELDDSDFVNAGNYVKLKSECNASLFALLKRDVESGKVYPAVRNDELHFYYKGGCLYKFTKGVFLRDSKYRLYGNGTISSPYERAKKENENKHTNKKGGNAERQLLDKLYCHTYNPESNSKVVVLDIEVNLKGNVGGGKKCDLVLLNTATCEIMFVEGKVYYDKRVRHAVGHIPEVIEQVNVYTAAIAEQRDNIITQYGEYVRIVNGLFGTDYKPPEKLIRPAKLLVYKTGGGKEENVGYTVNTINEKLGAGNVAWINNEEPTLEEIWDLLK